MDDKDLDNWFEEAKAADDDGRQVAAVEILSRYVAHRPEHALAWHILGDGLRILRRYEEALRVMIHAEAIALEDERFCAQARLGTLHKDWGKYDEAERWFATATANSHARHAGYVWILRGAALAAAGKLAEAEACHRKAVTLDDVDIDEALLNLGYVLRAQGRYAEAIESFDQAFALDSTCADNREAVKSLDGIPLLLERLKTLALHE
jgi:tetratricopeptide (TPR) repeat protein